MRHETQDTRSFMSLVSRLMTSSFLSPVSRLSPFSFTLKSWPVVAGVTIGLCYLTQLVAGWFGVTLAEQDNLELVRQAAGWNWNFVFLCAQILLIMPALEELFFRGLLFKLPGRWLNAFVLAIVSSAVFSFAHYPDYLHLNTGFALRPLDNAFLALFFFGLAQCWITRRTGRLWCAMLNHTLFNLTNLILLFIIPAPTP